MKLRFSESIAFRISRLSRLFSGVLYLISFAWTRLEKDKDGWRKSFTKVLDPSFLSTQVMMGGRIRTETEERNG